MLIHPKVNKCWNPLKSTLGIKIRWTDAQVSWPCFPLQGEILLTFTWRKVLQKLSSFWFFLDAQQQESAGSVIQDFSTYFRFAMLLSLALPPIGQGLLLILSQALFSGLYYLLDVYVIEVWPTEVFLPTNQASIELLIFSGPQLWLQPVGKCQQGWISPCSTGCWPWRSGM